MDKETKKTKLTEKSTEYKEIQSLNESSEIHDIISRLDIIIDLLEK